MEKKFITDIQVRFRDLDSLRHVNNAVYFTYFEEGRKEFVGKVCGFHNVDEYNFIIAHVCCDFIKPLTLKDQVNLQLWVSNIGTKSFIFNYELTDKGDESVIYARGKSVQVCFDYTKNITIQIPDEFLAKLKEYAF